MTILDPRGGIDLYLPSQVFRHPDMRRTVTLNVAMASDKRGTNISIEDHYGNHRGSRVNIRLYLVFMISPPLLIGFRSSLALTESYSPGESNAGLGDKFGAELAENVG